MKFVLDGYLVGAQFESQVSSLLDENPDIDIKSLRNVQFDLSEIEFIDCYCAQLLICYIGLFDRQGTIVSLRLPKKKRVRDMIRVWQFDTALKDAVGSRMVRFCDDDDREKYFYPNDQQATFDTRLFPTYYEEANDQEDPESLTPRYNFFGFRSIEVPDNVEVKPEIANSEKRLWQSHNIKSLLERDLKIDVRYFSARIIFEAVFNALRHPSAEIVQTATHSRYIYEESQIRLKFDDSSPSNDPHKKPKKPKKSAVTHYWDNGTSILNIINKKLDAGGIFRTAEAGDYAKTYRLIWKGLNDETPSIDRIVKSDEDADKNSHVSQKLLFVLQPFVSMAPTLFGHASTDETTEDDPRLASVGMGLHLLLDTAVTMFGGKVRVRTANIHMDIYKGKRSQFVDGVEHEKHDYTVEIKQMSDRLPIFPGNIITISIPEQKTPTVKVGQTQ